MDTEKQTTEEYPPHRLVRVTGVQHITEPRGESGPPEVRVVTFAFSYAQAVDQPLAILALAEQGEVVKLGS